MTTTTLYEAIVSAQLTNQKLMAILLDPDKFDVSQTKAFLERLPKETSHLLVGGSTVPKGLTEVLVTSLKSVTALPIILFPGDVSQLTNAADGVLFLSLLSGNNPEYLIGQQAKAVKYLKETSLEVIPTGYVLIDGGNESAVARVTDTLPMSQSDIEAIASVAKAGEYMGAKLIYLEAGSGANVPVHPEIIQAVKSILHIPLIVGGGIRSAKQLRAAYDAGADMVVMGTAFEAISS